MSRKEKEIFLFFPHDLFFDFPVFRVTRDIAVVDTQQRSFRDRYALKVTFTALLGPVGTRSPVPVFVTRGGNSKRVYYTRSLPDDSVYFRNSNPKVHSRVAQQRVTITFLFRRLATLLRG